MVKRYAEITRFKNPSTSRTIKKAEVRELGRTSKNRDTLR